MSKKAWIKLSVISAAVILFLILVWRNSGVNAELDFLIWKRQFPLVVLMIVVFGLGFIAGIFTALKISSGQKKKP